MKKILIIIVLGLFLFCCKTMKPLTNIHNIYIDTYIAPMRNMDSIYFEKKNRYELIFINDTACIFRHTFFCSDIATEYSIIEQNCRYLIKDSMLIVRNVQQIYGNDWYINIPVQESKKCPFLSKNGHQIMLGIGTLYYIYGRVPNITNDTLYYSKQEKNLIILNKYNTETSESVYCEFRKIEKKR
jgi:hypothetical protein